MKFESELQARSGNACELCGATARLCVYAVPPPRHESASDYAYLCDTCITLIETPGQTDAAHWRCLNTSAWSEVPAVQVLAWRLLQRLKGEGWSDELADMLYLDDETRAWAESLSDEEPHRDANGAILQAGDTVILTQDLKVKGAGFTAKRGTAVRRISLVAGNPEQIEGKVEGQRIVILTKYVRKKHVTV